MENHLTVAGASAEYQPSWSIWVLDVERGTYLFAIELSSLRSDMVDYGPGLVCRTDVYLAVGGVPTHSWCGKLTWNASRFTQYWGQYTEDIEQRWCGPA